MQPDKKYVSQDNELIFVLQARIENKHASKHIYLLHPESRENAHRINNVYEYHDSINITSYYLYYITIFMALKAMT